MPEFKADSELDPLTYDFRPHAELDGTVPEPSQDQVQEFYDRLGNQVRYALAGDPRLEGYDPTDPEKVGDLLASLTIDDNRALHEQLIVMHADVCSNQPDADAIRKLPFRLRRAWFGAVQGWLRPEA